MARSSLDKQITGIASQAQPPIPLTEWVPLTTAQVAALIGIDDNTLRFWRMSKPLGEQPPFIKIGKSVRYYAHQVEAWLHQQQKSVA